MQPIPWHEQCTSVVLQLKRLPLGTLCQGFLLQQNLILILECIFTLEK